MGVPFEIKRPQTREDGVIYLDNFSHHLGVLWNDSNLSKLCENPDYCQLILSDPEVTTHGEYSIKSDKLIFLTIKFKVYSNVKLTIDCPKLMKLVIDNCNNLIMSESTKPRFLELINCSGQINVPENIDENKTYEYRYAGVDFVIDDFKIKERYLKKP